MGHLVMMMVVMMMTTMMMIEGRFVLKRQHDDDGIRQKYSTNFRNGYLSPVPAACRLSVKVVHKERNNGNYDKEEDSGLR